MHTLPHVQPHHRLHFPSIPLISFSYSARQRRLIFLLLALILAWLLWSSFFVVTHTSAQEAAAPAAEIPQGDTVIDPQALLPLPLPGYHRSMALDGETLIIGVPYYYLPGTDETSGIGAVYVFVRSDTTWTQQAFLLSPTLSTGGHFGHNVAISGDTLVVGAPYESYENMTGAAFVFVRSGTTWNQQAILRASAWNTYGFGRSVDIDGDTVVVSAIGEDQFAGAAYVFTRSGELWTQQARLKASNPESFDYFGTTVAVDDNTVVVGAQNEDSDGSSPTNNSAANSGAAYVFVRSGTTWSQTAYLKASNAGAWDAFGSQVTLDGDTLAISAPFEYSNGVPTDNSRPGSGAVYIFTRSGGNWSQQAYLKAEYPDRDDNFGAALALNGDTLLVGMSRDDSSGSPIDNSLDGAGAVYVFRRSANAWTRDAYLKANPVQEYGNYGGAVALDAIEGAAEETFAITSENGVYVYSAQEFAGTVAFSTPTGTRLENAVTYSVPVRLTTSSGSPLTEPVSVTLSFSGSATFGEDYIAETTLTFTSLTPFENGAYTDYFGLYITDDDLEEPSETVVITLTNPNGVLIGGQNAHTLTIIDNDSARPTLIAPTGQIDAPQGNPTYTWTDTGAARYHLAVWTADYTTLIYYDQDLADALYCDGDTCSIDPTTHPTHNEAARLSDGSYEAWVCAGDCAGMNDWGGPFGFTLDAPLPPLVTDLTITQLETLRPQIQWNASGNTTAFDVYLAPTAASGSPVLYERYYRSMLCYGMNGTMCDFELPFDLVDEQPYSLYVLAISPGGTAVGGPDGSGWISQAFTPNMPNPPMPEIQSASGANRTPILQFTTTINASHHSVSIFSRTTGVFVHFATYSKVDSPEMMCAPMACTLTLTGLNLPNGSYTYFVNASGQGGPSSGGDFGGYAGSFNLENETELGDFSIGLAAPTIQNVTITNGLPVVQFFTAENTTAHSVYIYNWATNVWYGGTYPRSGHPALMCTGGLCTFSDPSLNLTNGQHSVFVNAIDAEGASTGGPINNGYGGPSDGTRTDEIGDFNLTTPIPELVDAASIVSTGSGNSIQIAFTGVSGAASYNVWVGTQTFSTYYFGTLSSAALGCMTGTNCTAPLTLHFGVIPAGSQYLVAVQSTGPGGWLMTGGTYNNGYAVSNPITTPIPPMVAVESINGSGGGTTLTVTFTGVEHATSYNLWVGTEALATYYFGAVTREALDCTAGATCTAVLTMQNGVIPAGSAYLIGVQSMTLGGGHTTGGRYNNGYAISNPITTPIPPMVAVESINGSGGGTTLTVTFTGVEHATSYNLWVGTEALATYYFGAVTREALGCTAGATCTAVLTMQNGVIPAGSAYLIGVQSVMPGGGHTTGGTYNNGFAISSPIIAQ